MFPKVYPHLKGLLQFDATAQDSFKEGRPLGVVIHYTADRNLVEGVKSLVARKLGYHLIIDRDGGVYQMTSLDRKCWHAGSALWHGRSPNHHFLAVSLVSWGFLKPMTFESYAGTKIRIEDVEQRPDNVKGIVQPWDAATDLQLVALDEVLRFCITNGIEPEMICGHDECALPFGRKLDPGGVLPWSMAKLRERLKRAERLA
jgi:N-acetyl-anhydromuramyl-L-alanine amidase AmpD